MAREGSTHTVDSGGPGPSRDLLGSGSGTFTCRRGTKAHKVQDPNFNLITGTVVLFPRNREAAILLRQKACWVDIMNDGSFVFNVDGASATVPTGKEVFGYVVSN